MIKILFRRNFRIVCLFFRISVFLALNKYKQLLCGDGSSITFPLWHFSLYNPRSVSQVHVCDSYFCSVVYSYFFIVLGWGSR